MIINSIIGGNGGETASIFVTGLSETDTVTATKDGKRYDGKWINHPNPEYHGLPSGYTELEYIQSDGNQYIDTGIYGTDLDRFEFTYQFIESTGTWQLFGCESSNSPTIFRRFGITKTPTWWLDETDTGISADYNKHDIIVNWNTTKFSIDSVEKSFTKGSNQSPARYTTHLFRCGGDHTPKYVNKARLYSFKYYQGATLVRDFIPCTRDSDSSIGLYDLVTNQFFTNSGTGTFVAGAEIPSTINGHFIDKLNEYGTYTVTATDGTNTTTQDVLIDIATQYNIKMRFSKVTWLYNLGDECEDITGGYVSTQHTTPQGGGGVFTKNTTSIYVKGTGASSCGEYGCRTSNKIDFSPYKTLHINILSSVQSGYYPTCAKITISSVETYDGPTTIKLLSVEGSPTGELELDISGISNTPYYLLVVGLAVNGSITIDKIWLE